MPRISNEKVSEIDWFITDQRKALLGTIPFLNILQMRDIEEMRAVAARLIAKADELVIYAAEMGLMELEGNE